MEGTRGREMAYLFIFSVFSRMEFECELFFLFVSFFLRFFSVDVVLASMFILVFFNACTYVGCVGISWSLRFFFFRFIIVFWPITPPHIILYYVC